MFMSEMEQQLTPFALTYSPQIPNTGTVEKTRSFSVYQVIGDSRPHFLGKA